MTRTPPQPLAAAALGVLFTTGTLILLAVLWILVGRPVENLTGALFAGLAADGLTFCLLAALAGVTGVGMARLARRS